jgi:hypothetical protein
MEALVQAQNMVVEHAFTIGIGLLVATLLAAGVWYWMSRGSSKSNVLVNQARVNTVEMAPPEVAMGPTQDQLEQEANMANQVNQPAVDQLPGQ